MAVYRVYFVDAQHRLEPGEAFYCSRDSEAMCKLPRPPRPGVRAELWQGGRFVAAATIGRPVDLHGTAFAPRAATTTGS